MASKSLKRHLKEHSGEQVLLKCTTADCKSTVRCVKSRRRHVKLFHGEGSDVLKF